MSCNRMPGGRRRGTRKMRGGMGHGMGEAINAGNFVHAPSNTSVPVNSATGGVEADIYAGGDSASKIIGGRRRKTKKSGKKSKKGGRKSRKSPKSRKSRRMRGGAGVYNSAVAGSSFTGAVSGMPGAQGYGAYSGYNVANPAGNPHSAGADGVMQLA